MTEDNFKLDRYLNREIKTLFKDVLKTIIKEPSLAKFFIQTYRWQKRAGNLRLSWEKKGVHVPPFMIFSITMVDDPEDPSKTLPITPDAFLY